ncbi:hypothetical protein EW146_g1812 [Bondarzewia mesenterica]|uniref:Uncharacterized protein n=1 Tax=Bondarzewia mesenterica TaxID=1095465 RepID=A0A4S4M4X5_9AGAM|nr:hypothetical protein EW146_g1812 [Bondarzewia mesenterica]
MSAFGGGGLFGSSNAQQSSNPQQQQPGSGLFGTASQPQNTGTGLLGSSNTNANVGGGASGGGLFGNTANQASGSGSSSGLPGGSLFGAANANQGQSAGGGLFGSQAGQGQGASGIGGGGLFGGSNTSTNQQQQPPTGGGLFGSSATTTTTQPATGGGLFGSSTTQPAAGGGLFGTSNTTQQPATGAGLFGSSMANQSSTGMGGGLFGSTNQQQQPATGGGLFGSSTMKPASGGLFGTGSSTSTTGGGGLFGNTPSTGAGTSSLFGTPSGQTQQQSGQQPGSALFGSTQQQGSGLLGGSLYGARSTLGSGGLGGAPSGGSLFAYKPAATPTQQQTDAQTQFVQLQQRIEGIVHAYNPNSPLNRFQHYFYNLVDPAQVHLYGRPVNATDEALWQKALRENPNPTCLVPVLATSFDDLQKRVEAQAEQANMHQQKLKELKSRIEKLSERHDLSNASRLHKAASVQTQITQRLLQLVQHLHLLIPTLRSSTIRPEEEALRITLEDIDSEIRRPGGMSRIVGKLNELWAVVGAINAVHGGNARLSGTAEVSWAVVDEDGLNQIVQPIPFKKARPAQDKNFARQSYRLATGGEDNHVRIWMVHPNIMPPSLVEGASADATGVAPTPRPPRVEYLATLSRHSAAVNVVRFSPSGELIASAGDDGMIIIWAPSTTPNQSLYGSDLSAEEMQFDKEFWKPRTTFRCTQMQVYDLAWSPSGEYIIAGSTDNAARIFSAADGKCIHEIAEHNHYVQGVAWDPLNEYIATQSSDRSMHVYSISNKQGGIEVHAVGRNSRMSHHRARTPSSHSQSRPRMFRRESTTSDTESVITNISEQPKDDSYNASMLQPHNVPLTPATSIASTPSQSMFPPPPMDTPSSRRSSFSGSNAPSSPAHYARYGRSPSPMPALPAIRTSLPSPATWPVKLYGDESFTNFFRRLTFSPDGGLLLTPAGHFEDLSIIPGSSRTSKTDEPSRGRKSAPNSELANPTSASSVYIYSRANFARPPIAQLPGHKKASIAVKFSPILYELRPGVFGPDVPTDTKNVVVEKGKEETVAVDVGTAPTIVAATSSISPALGELLSPISPVKHGALLTPLVAPAPLSVHAQSLTLPSPALSASDSLRAGSPAISKPPTPKPATPAPSTGSVFALPYRMLFAVATMDSVAIHDTQQAGPVCILTKLHYDEFTDMSWSPDGQCLMLSSRDGYCTIVVFDEILPAHHTQQQTLQFQSIAHHHSVPLTTTSLTPATTPSLTSVSLPSSSPVVTPTIPLKRNEPPPTPASTSGTDELPDKPSDHDNTTTPTGSEQEKAPEPPKKKRRVALTRVGDIGS